MKNIHILIVEDEPLAQSRLINTLRNFGYKKITTCDTSDDAIVLLNKEVVDLAIVDIRLDGSTFNGIELVEYINARFTLPIIYVTALSDLTTLKNAAQTKFTEYITKPYTPQQLHAAMELTLLKHPDFEFVNNEYLIKTTQEVWLKKGKSYHKIVINDIVYIESEDKLIYIHSVDTKFPFSASLKSLERKILSPSLIRIHQRFIVNKTKIVAFEPGDSQVKVAIKDRQISLPVGPTFRKGFFSQFHKLHTD